MTGGPKLNLGCGWDYKPGYLNIDSAGSSAADESGDASDLRFGDNSVERIEAMQLLEHFDLVHCRYVLAEWFRVLAPNGELVLESPDLQTSLRRIQADKADYEAMMRWVFGIDSPGLQHKSGFTKRALRELLREAGFAEIAFAKPETYASSPGLRASCRKPVGDGDAHIMAVFRKRLRKSIGDDSFVLVPLEKWVSIARTGISRLNDAESRRSLLARLATCHPGLATSFLEAVNATGGLDGKGTEAEMDTLRWLQSVEFHRRAFALWTKSRKDPGKGAEDFDRMQKRLEESVVRAFSSPESRGRSFEYILNTRPREIGAMDWWLVAEESQKLLSMAVKAHGSGDMETTIRRLEESIQICPDNLIAHWNLGRVLAHSGDGRSRADECYRTAARLADRKTAAIVERERLLANAQTSRIPSGLMSRQPSL